MSKFIILCGGTGGHLAPGLAVGQSLIEAGHKASFVVSKKEVDSRLVQKYADLDVIRAPGVAFPKNPLKIPAFLLELRRAVKMGIGVLREGGYDAVISFGGFNSLGFSFAAAWLGIPIVLHEANRKPGKATRLLGRFAKRIYVPFGVKIPRRKSGQVKYSGYPIRGEIKKLPARESKKFFGFPANSVLLLVLGGSQGATVLNKWADENFEKFADAKIDVLCVCGQGKDTYQSREKISPDGTVRKIKFIPFCDNMASAMSAADAVVARAGAGTIAELARCRVPSAIVPYPFAADNHQLENARCFERQGACVVVEQDKMQTLFDEVLEIVSNQTLRERMLQNLERVDDLNDTSKIVADLAAIASGDAE
ncbi:MAG: UDP-N-acetylglucosamine--N-acetylmuramyl-(pentapeptide) pyrophosphoryl-undecaprenol N-acetylglucosamine transferase [Opitutales bacterium]|nr:UDP-N-acetylglucosamine--N-acetylmuramyl-(pentapeptide) pyrophosphoryl-undecaprenol N-acetylglucosamine transferase [Opitutales bacterium]